MEPGTLSMQMIYVTAQYPSVTEVEHTIGDALDELTTYYRSNSLRANPDKTQVTAFRLKNREAKRTLEVKWNNTDLENTPHPKYLGVTLDRTLSYKKHIHDTKMKVCDICHKQIHGRCCYRPTPPVCSCGGVRQPSFSREALPGVSST